MLPWLCNAHNKTEGNRVREREKGRDRDKEMGRWVCVGREKDKKNLLPPQSVHRRPANQGWRDWHNGVLELGFRFQ